MSEMQFFHGYFKESTFIVEPEDTDDFYDLEEEMGCHFVKVNGKLFQFWSSSLDVDAYGFSVVAPACDFPQLMLYWYNGGAGLHEVAEWAIEKWLKENTYEVTEE
jgi:hypothetical protein